MKFLGAASLIGTSHAMGYVNQRQQQHHYQNEAKELVDQHIQWITERRLVPELVSHDEIETDNEDPDYRGFYWMERPHVNFWLDFNNPELISFRQHSSKYQSARNMLSTARMAFGAKKSGYEYEEVRTSRYHNYQDENEERFTRPTRNHLLRRLASVENMVQYSTTDFQHKKPFGAFFDYGCHCFPGSFIDPKRSPHATPVDDIDRACQSHQWAYDCAKDDYGNDCRGKYQLYSWKGRIGDDGISTEITCLDPEDSCAWAICEIDKHLAETLADLVIDYNEDYKLRNGRFDRIGFCEQKEMQIVDRSAHNNNIHVEDDEPVQIFSNNESPADERGDFGTVQLASAGSPAAVVSVSPQEMSRGSVGSPDIPYGITPDGTNWDVPVDPFDFELYGDNIHNPPLFQFVGLDIRKIWVDNFGWPNELVDLEYIPVKQKETEADSWNQDPFLNFFGNNDLPLDEDLDIPVAPYNHAVEDTPTTAEALEAALDQTNDEIAATDAPAISFDPVFADDASEYAGEGSPVVEDSGNGQADNAPADDSSAEEEEAAPQVTLKSAATFNHRKCCGEYPKRYKYSSNKQGCCIENVGPYANQWGYLYAPSRGKCCHKAKSVRGEGSGTITYTRFAGLDQNCDHLLDEY